MKQRAKDIYRDYLKLAFEDPEVAEPHKGASLQDARYQWFVAFLLTSCDDIVRFMPGDKTWRNGIRKDLEPHLEYFKSGAFKDDGGWDPYSPELKTIADEAANKKEGG